MDCSGEVVGEMGNDGDRPMSKQSAKRGLPIPGASAPTSLQKFQASRASLRPSFRIPGSPTAEMYSVSPPTKIGKRKQPTATKSGRAGGRPAEAAMDVEGNPSGCVLSSLSRVMGKQLGHAVHAVGLNCPISLRSFFS